MRHRERMLANQKLLEMFIDHIETDDTERHFWLSRIRKLGFDNALLEFKQHRSHTSRIHPVNGSAKPDLNRKPNA